VVCAHQATRAEVVQHFDGHIAQYLGDGLLVYFGSPPNFRQGKKRKMKKVISVALMLITLVFTCGVLAKAQTPIRIQFAKGKSSAVVKGTTGSYGVTYVVRAKSGQKLVLTLTPTATVGIKVETERADGVMVLLREERGGTYEVGLEESGDYTIFVGSTNNNPVAFTLTVKITKLADI
jgi:hypothetical protein